MQKQLHRPAKRGKRSTLLSKKERERERERKKN
jgi:hypothetical protein